MARSGYTTLTQFADKLSELTKTCHEYKISHKMVISDMHFINVIFTAPDAEKSTWTTSYEPWNCLCVKRDLNSEYDARQLDDFLDLIKVYARSNPDAAVVIYKVPLCPGIIDVTLVPKVETYLPVLNEIQLVDLLNKGKVVYQPDGDNQTLKAILRVYDVITPKIYVLQAQNGCTWYTGEQFYQRFPLLPNYRDIDKLHTKRMEGKLEIVSWKIPLEAFETYFSPNSVPSAEILIDKYRNMKKDESVVNPTVVGSTEYSYYTAVQVIPGIFRLTQDGPVNGAYAKEDDKGKVILLGFGDVNNMTPLDEEVKKWAIDSGFLVETK